MLVAWNGRRCRLSIGIKGGEPICVTGRLQAGVSAPSLRGWMLVPEGGTGHGIAATALQLHEMAGRRVAAGPGPVRLQFARGSELRFELTSADGTFTYERLSEPWAS